MGAPTFRLLRRQEVEERTGLARSSPHRLMRAGEFPPSLKIYELAMRWPASEIEAWLPRGDAFVEGRHELHETTKIWR